MSPACGRQAGGRQAGSRSAQLPAGGSMGLGRQLAGEAGESPVSPHINRLGQGMVGNEHGGRHWEGLGVGSLSGKNQKNMPQKQNPNEK